LSKLPILEGVLKYVKENNILFCMPGHKGGKGFEDTSIGKEFVENFMKFDITEVEGVDNLHNAEGIIKDASNLLSRFYGSKKSYFLVNGSTSGNMAMIFSSFNEGDKVIVERNCHRSIFNAIIMRKLKPVYVKNIISERLNAPIAIDLEHFLQVLEDNDDAKGIVVTYPNYYGICSNLEFIIDKAKKHGMKVLVDSAHGAHFGVNDNLPKSAIKLGADMVVTSTHKTLSSLTQTAYLHVNDGQDIDKVDFYVSAFLSTSPSYLFLCSMDYARFYLESYGEVEYEKLLNIASYYRDKINEIKGIHIIGIEDIINLNAEIKRYRNENNDLNYVWNLDATRYVINLNKEYDGNLLLSYLRRFGIQAEMSDISNVVLIFSPFSEEEEFKRLYEILKKCNLNDLKKKELSLVQYDIPKAKIMPYEVIDKEKEFVKLEDCLGRISAENIVPYPPGIPILAMGELIDKESLDIIKYYKNNGTDILGIQNDEIKVVR
jgi:arginine/lysine/ornithine decarboxylase